MEADGIVIDSPLLEKEREREREEKCREFFLLFLSLVWVWDLVRERMCSSVLKCFEWQ